MATRIFMGTSAALRDAAIQAINATLGTTETYFGAPYSPTGGDPITWWVASMPMNLADANAILATADNPAANLPDPVGGWPLNGISKAQAIAASAAMYVSVASDPEDSVPEAMRLGFVNAMALQPWSAL